MSKKQTAAEFNRKSLKGMTIVSESPAAAKARNATKTPLYLIEFYRKGPDGETGWDIHFAWVNAATKQEAREKLAEKDSRWFDCVITIDEHAEVTPLHTNKVPLRIY